MTTNDLDRVKEALGGDLLLAGTRGTTGLMKNRKNNLLPFPRPPEEPGTSTIIAQIGSERFAIHMQIEDLPPAAPPVVLLKGRTSKGTFQDCEVAAGKTTADGNEIPAACTPVELGSTFGDWRVLLAGWLEQTSKVLSGDAGEDRALKKETPPGRGARRRW
jgi:hypothetical protein